MTWGEILFEAGLFVFIQEISSFVILEVSVCCDGGGVKIPKTLIFVLHVLMRYYK